MIRRMNVSSLARGAQIFGMMMICALSGGAIGCAYGDVEPVQVGDADAGTLPDESDRPDAKIEPGETEDPDAGSDPDEDDLPDADEPGTDPVDLHPGVPSAAPSAGGGRMQTPNHQIRLIVGPRGGAGRADTAEYQILMGAGAAQHAPSSD